MVIAESGTIGWGLAILELVGRNKKPTTSREADILTTTIN
jgi:hypothetical protein